MRSCRTAGEASLGIASKHRRGYCNIRTSGSNAANDTEFMANVGLVYDSLYLEHDTGAGHPERSERLSAIVSSLHEAGLWQKLTQIEATDATLDDLELVHDESLIDAIHRFADAGGGYIDPDTVVSPRSYDIALRAVGGCLRAVDAVWSRRMGSAFCLVRPPGHHATPDRAMGFCLFNNVAIAARYSIAKYDLERVAIVDFDVHHGNGTQDAFYADPSVLYFSTHQYPYYPGTGHWQEHGAGAGAGTTLNVPLPAGCGDVEYRRVFAEIMTPALKRFRPQLMLISAGFDAHFSDPLAQMRLSARGYYDLASTLKSLADELCSGRVVVALEGGYDLTALAWSVRACVDVLLGNDLAPDPLGIAPAVQTPDIGPLIEAIKRHHDL